MHIQEKRANSAYTFHDFWVLTHGNLQLFLVFQGISMWKNTDFFSRNSTLAQYYKRMCTRKHTGTQQSHKVPCSSHLVFGVQNAAITSSFWGAECSHRTQLLPQPPLLAKRALSGYESFCLSIKVKKNRFFKGVIHLSWFSPFPTQGALGD